MPQTLPIPAEVTVSIARHISASVEQARGEYLSASEDEDTLTGHLGARLTVRNQHVAVSGGATPQIWTWAIQYRKFRGRGHRATERTLGADGIFQLQVNYAGEPVQKSLMFQAKNRWSTDRSLLAQCVKLSTWREAAFVLNFTPAKFEAFLLDDVIRSHGVRHAAGVPLPLEQLLAEQFLPCNIGDNWLRYDAVARRLSWRAITGDIVSTRFVIPRRIRIRIDPPQQRRVPYRDVPNDKLHEFRMQATPEEMLSLSRGATRPQVARARGRLALAYHADRHMSLSDLDFAILNRRMQEINQAAEILRRRGGRSQ